jgi:hypothetical protein
MSSNLDAEPLGFFSLSQELRDLIVSTKLINHGSDQDTLLTCNFLFEQYDMLHQDEVTADFGAKKGLQIRYPLPRLHQISRRFTDECDLRAPAQSLVVISQKHVYLNTFTARVRCPRVLRLRRMPRFLVPQLQIDLRLGVPDNGDDSIWGLEYRLSNLFGWVKRLISNNCSKVDAGNVRLRLMFDPVNDIHTIERSLNMFSNRQNVSLPGRIQAVINHRNEQ